MRKLILLFVLSSKILSGQSISTSIGSYGSDNVVKSNAGTTVYTSLTTLQCTRDASNNISRSLLSFNLSGIPSNAIISSAVLTLYGTAHSGSNAAYLKRNTASWDQSSATWNTKPATTTTGQISLSQSSSATQNYVLNVQSIIQDMINIPGANYGWTLVKQNEGVTGELVFASADHATSALRPKLDITYSIPMDVKGAMVQATGISSANGGLNVTVSNGIPPYTYSWNDGSVTKDISGKLPGLYTLTVTDNGGNQVKKIMMIGADNTTMTFTITPDALSGKDAAIQIKDDGTLAHTNIRDFNQIKAQRGTATQWLKNRSLLGFDLSSLPATAIVNDASLILYGDGHNPLSRPNTAYLCLNTQSWDEVNLTWANQPAHLITDKVFLAGTSSANEITIANVTGHVQSWVQSPYQNNGWKLMLKDEVTSSYSIRAYGSSDHATAALRPKLTLTVTFPVAAALTDAQRNWTMEETYDESGALLSVQKVFMDNLGRPTQSLNQDAAGNVLASQTVYDAYGRAAINSLPAYAGNTLDYKTDFMLNTAGQEYNFTNFDVGTSIINPAPLDNTLPNSLGYYYSNNNTLDTWQATTSTPFNRTQFMANPANEVKTANGADEAFNSGAGREVRNYSMVCGDELKYVFGDHTSYKVSVNTGDPMNSNAMSLATGYFIKATKSVATSPDNKEVITYSIGDDVIASCMSGLDSPDNCEMKTIKNYMDWYGTQSVDIHIPEATKSTIYFPLPTYEFGIHTLTVPSADITYVITDQTTEEVLSDVTDYSINSTTRNLTFSPDFLIGHSGKPLFLRIRCAYTSTFTTGLFSTGGNVPSGIVQYDQDYGRWSVSYYDLAGNLRKSVSTKGIDCNNPGLINMATTYDYNHLGELIATQSPDENLKEFVYNTEGQLRFSQDAEQKQANRFSYTNYDRHGRSTQSGEFTTNNGTDAVYFQNYYQAYTAPYGGNVPSNLFIDEPDTLYLPYCSDVSYISYEKPDAPDDIPSGYTYAPVYAGRYRNGLVSKTWNSNTSTWYKYDAANRLTASVKKIHDADFSSYAGKYDDQQIKTSDVSYDPYLGLVTNTYFQKNDHHEYAEQQYTYDVNKRLSSVNFVAGMASISTPVTSLGYDPLGRVIRKELGPGLQGVDYVFTINGQLKAINHPGLDPAKDRGNDSRDYTGSGTGAFADLFGEILNYHPGDYARDYTGIETNTIGKYNGMIYGVRYKTRNDVNGIITGANYIDYMGANQVQLLDLYNYPQEELANRYEYDVFGQLANSTFGTYDNANDAFAARTDYKEYGAFKDRISYDANGNITRLQRNAYDVSGSPQLLDDLSYNYTGNTNRLDYVLDDAVNGFGAGFNFKNDATGSPGTIYYNLNGQMVQTDDERISNISYYPNGQMKQINFANGNTSSYFYDDGGNKYKTAYYDGNTGNTRYKWYIFGTVYEVNSNIGSFDLKEMSVNGSGRAGVYKQDSPALNITNGHLEYELTDHLGNVRATFKAGAGTDLEILSKADYYAFGGTMPGRVWQQSGGEYRFGYQGQEKSQTEVNWDEFELRQYNHDLGRWSAPDPYGQFHSPYVAMSNNPVSMVDPDGGYVNMSSEGQAQRQSFLNQLDWDRSLQRGRFSYTFLYNNYKTAIDELYQTHFSGINRDNSGYKFLEDLLKLNNNFMGLGLSSEYLSSGMDYVSQSVIQSDFGKGLMSDLTHQNGTSAALTAAIATIPSPGDWLTKSPAERRALGLENGIYLAYTLVGAYINKRQVGERDNDSNGENNDFVTGYEYHYETNDGKQFHSYISSKEGGPSLKDKPGSNSGKIMTSAITFGAGAAIADGPLPVGEVVGAGVVVGASIYVLTSDWTYTRYLAHTGYETTVGIVMDLFAHTPKKQSTGKAGKDKHDKQYTHGGKNRPVNPNKPKGADSRRNKGKTIN